MCNGNCNGNVRCCTGFEEISRLQTLPHVRRWRGTGTCVATVTGGTGIYTYSWEPEPVRVSGNRARIPCILNSNQNVWLTVTDSNGASAFFATSFFCDEAA